MTQDANSPLHRLIATLEAKMGFPATTPPDAFHGYLARLEAEGQNLLAEVEHAGHTIHEIGEHHLKPVAPAPHTQTLAMALPLAQPHDILHASEHAIVRAFLDAEDVLRHVYLNVHGLWVKA